MYALGSTIAIIIVPAIIFPGYRRVLRTLIKAPFIAINNTITALDNALGAVLKFFMFIALVAIGPLGWGILFGYFCLKSQDRKEAIQQEQTDRLIEAIKSIKTN